MKNKKLKLAGDALYLAIVSFQVLQAEGDSTKGYLSNDVQYEIDSILEKTKDLIESSLQILSNLNGENEGLDSCLNARFSEIFGNDLF